jgi:hypothetical protein
MASRGTTQTVISRLEGGAVTPTLPLLHRLGGALEGELNLKITATSTHAEFRLSRALRARRGMVDTEYVDEMAAGVVAQVRAADEFTVSGRPDDDQAAAGRDVEDFVDENCTAVMAIRSYAVSGGAARRPPGASRIAEPKLRALRLSLDGRDAGQSWATPPLPSE